MYKDLITIEMIEEINLKLKEQGTCLRILEEGQVFDNIKKYKLKIYDKFIDSAYMIPNPNEECEEFIRSFFKSKGVKLPFENQVLDIWGFEEEEL